MWGNTRTFKIVYYDHTVMYGDKKRVAFVEAYTKQDAIHKFQQDYGVEYVVRDCIELPF